MTIVPHQRTAQGKPVARRGRKARDLYSAETARLPVRTVRLHVRDWTVKANLGRFTTALALLATLALSLGAGVRWY
jgi:hypothetical protein